MAGQRQLVLKEGIPSGFPTQDSHGYYIQMLHQLIKMGSEEQVRNTILNHIDDYWADHLARVADIREGIHLFRLSGQIPLDEYHKQVQDAFHQMIEHRGKKIIMTLENLLRKRGDVEFTTKNLSDPASTWTYMLNDNPFTNLGIALIASRNIGFAVGAARSLILYAPFIVMILILKSLRRRVTGNRNGS